MALYAQAPSRRKGQMWKLLPLQLGWYCLASSLPHLLFHSLHPSTTMQFSSISDTDYL